MQVEASRSAATKVLTVSGGRRPRLLFAEDCDPVRVVTTAMLKGMGCDVEAAEHGEIAVRLAESQHFDLIVLDIEMPVMDGITAARFIRRMKGECLGTPLMALSAFLADGTQQATWDDTFDLALPKPTSKSDLQAAISTALSWTSASEMMARFAAEPVLNDGSVSSLRSGLPASVWNEILGITRKDIETCLGAIEDIVALRRYQGLPREAFKLKSVGRTFGAPRLARAAELLECTASRREIDVIVGHLRNVVADTLSHMAA